MSDEGATIASAEHEGITVETNSGATKAQLLESISGERKSGPKTATPPAKEPKSDEEKRSEAASELGKAGGKAAAEKRKIKPIPPKEKADEAERTAAARESEPEGTERAHPKPDGAEGEPAEEAKGQERGASEAETEEEKSEEKPLGKPRDDPRARMLEATRKESEAKRALAEARQQNEELKARLESIERRLPTPEPKEEGPKTPKGKPSLAEYDDLEAYLDARESWDREQARTRSMESEQDRLFGEQRQRFTDAMEKAGGWEGISPDLVAVLKAEFQLTEGEKPSGQNWIANELFFSPERARALMLHFTEHPEEFQRIAALKTPRDVSRAVASLETRLEAATPGISSKPEVERSKAPAPIKPVQGGPYVAEGDGAPRSGESFDSWWKRVGHKGANLPQR